MFLFIKRSCYTNYKLCSHTLSYCTTHLTRVLLNQCTEMTCYAFCRFVLIRCFPLYLLTNTHFSTTFIFYDNIIFFITEGQAIGIRISKQFSANFSKIKKEVDFLNTVSNGVEDVKNFLSPSSLLLLDWGLTSL